MASSDGGGGLIRGTSTTSGASSGDKLGGGSAPRWRAGTSSLDPDTTERSQPHPLGSSAQLTAPEPARRSRRSPAKDRRSDRAVRAPSCNSPRKPDRRRSEMRSGSGSAAP